MAENPACYEGVLRLLCSHPPLDTNTELEWERNGTFYSVQGSQTHKEMINPSKDVTTLTINVTRFEFEGKNYEYVCILKNHSTSLSSMIPSNKVTVNPPGKCTLHALFCFLSS